MSLQELMEQFQVMSDRRREEDRARDEARLLEDLTFEGIKQSKLQALEAELPQRIPSYESRSAGAMRILKNEQDNTFKELQRKHVAQLKALQKKQEEEIAAFPEKFIRKAAEIESNLRIDMQWELELILEVEQSALENMMSVEKRRTLEARDREDRIRKQARTLVDQDLNSQVLTTFREEASRHNQPRRDAALELPISQRPLKSILKKPRGTSFNSDGTISFVCPSDDDETLDDRKSKRVKVEGSARRGRALDVLDQEATLFPYLESRVALSQTPRSPRAPWTPRISRTPQGSQSTA